MNTIKRLPESVINQIAAGEVVENPASVIKELIENSLDAKAERISIKIRHGGQQFIEIEDDGMGMSPEDAALCLERHATSKIHTIDDLYSLTTMGFRGEALASIASVSQLKLKTSDGNSGTEICISGGTIEKVQPIARNRGTTVTIQSLFFNVPARKKFQKSIGADSAAVTRIVETLAIANPEIAFSLEVQSKAALQLEPQPRRERAEAILGPFAHEIQGDGLIGYLSAPHEAKGHRRRQYLFINKRAVFSPVISRAVQTGYATRLAQNTYPPFVLFLDVNPSEVDVNVHPQKKEARFSNESRIFRKVELAVGRSFETPSFSEPISFDSPSIATDFSEFSMPTVQDFEEVPLDLQIEEKPLTLLGGYLLIERDGIIVVDLTAARARILFEELDESAGGAQMLMWPLEIDEDDPDTFTSLLKMGFDCRWLGPKRIAIDALPPSIEPEDFPAFFDAWKQGRKSSHAAVRFLPGAQKNKCL